MIPGMGRGSAKYRCNRIFIFNGSRTGNTCSGCNNNYKGSPKRKLQNLGKNQKLDCIMGSNSRFPGKFQVLFNDKLLTKTLFGTEEANWHWQDGGVIVLEKGELKLSLHDMTGFNGRCDAILLTDDLKFSPPNDNKTLSAFRKNH